MYQRFNKYSWQLPATLLIHVDRVHYVSVIEFIVGYKPDHHPEGEMLVCGV